VSKASYIARIEKAEVEREDGQNGRLPGKLSGSPALLVIPVKCDVVTLIEQRYSECSQRGTVMALIGLG